MAIAYITHKDIDIKKWDECLEHSPNRLIYAQRFYLDAMADHWDALVLDDYDAIMPLPWRKKWGIRYIYQPAFIQQGGVFSKRPLNDQTLAEFITLAARQFKFAEFTGNRGIKFPNSSNYDLGARVNYALDLRGSYQDLSVQYHSISKKNIKRALNTDSDYGISTDYKAIIEFYREEYEKRLPAFQMNDYQKFENICTRLAAENNLVCRTVMKPGIGMIAGAVLLRDGNRIYNLVSAVNSEGKKAQANYLLYDRLIEEFSGQSLILDFEGSDVPGIAEFYSRFNPAKENYQFVRFNNLPTIMKLFK